MKNTVTLYHVDGSRLVFKRAGIQVRTRSRTILVATANHGILRYRLKDLFGFVENTPRGTVVKDYLFKEDERYFGKVKIWTIPLQKRYIELIRKHGKCSFRALCALEIHELHWLSKERDRLRYPISAAERATQKRILKRVKALVSKQNAYYRDLA